jgi:hypothetical protein
VGVCHGDVRDMHPVFSMKVPSWLQK